MATADATVNARSASVVYTVFETSSCSEVYEAKAEGKPHRFHVVARNAARKMRRFLQRRLVAMGRLPRGTAIQVWQGDIFTAMASAPSAATILAILTMISLPSSLRASAF